MRVRIIFRAGLIPARWIAPKLNAAPLPEPELFRTVMAPRRPMLPVLMGSLAGHSVLLAALLAFSRYYTWSHLDDVDWSRYTVEPLRLQVSGPIFLPAGLGQRASGGDGAAHLDAEPEHSAVELPRVAAANPAAPTVLQPVSRPQLPKAIRLRRNVAFWARQSRRPEPGSAGQVVVPGRIEPPSMAARPAAAPLLAVPNLEALIADTNLSLPAAPAVNPPALAVPNSATVPVRLRGVTESIVASFESFAGQPVNVMALANERGPATQVEIPREYQNSPGLAPAGAGLFAAGRGNGGAGSVEGIAGSSTAGFAGGSSGGRSDGRTQSAANRALPPAGVDRMEANRVDAHRAGPLPAAELIRIQHPKNGSFDVVITQSLARDDLPDLAGMLSGSPVYTVYLGVGDHREWLLQYCLPVRAALSLSLYQVQIDDPGTVVPPYPVSTVIPNVVRERGNARPIVLRGMVAANGSVHVASANGGGIGWMGQLVALVNQWQFRPALRNLKPVDVEMLLVIPPIA